ncbi:MAG TPA: GGDEF domain-containing protein [Mesorhizobium sp.]|jgi:diguanylate cyclase (GGDEF)-like protein|nr:GGDEF domain-containing protein [Mesorhizobium sp.]
MNTPIAQARRAPDFEKREEVDSLLASHKVWVRSAPWIKERFEADHAEQRRRHHLIYGVIALVMFDVFLLYDLALVPDMAVQAAVLRLLVFTPVAAALLWGLLHFNSPFFREGSQALASVIAFAVILSLSAQSDSPLAVYHHFGAVLVLVFANVVQRLSFAYAVAASALCLAIYIPSVFAMEALPKEAGFAAAMLMAGGVLLTLFANLRMENQLRIAHLFHLRDEFRHAELDALARVDPLTGLGNRRQLDRHLAELWATRPEHAKPACVLVIDVDHFKKYNDRYGHPAGDLCLKRIAEAITSILDGTQCAAFRFGGEEFVVVLSGAELMDGVRTGDRIRAAVQALGIPHETAGLPGVVTLSIGVAASIPAGAISREEVIMSADSALYAAKHAGRNQVWPPLPKRSTSVAYLQEVSRSSRAAAS